MHLHQKDFILLIPCYQNLSGLLTSLQSIHYPFHLFEVLIIDDGSKVPIQQDPIRERFPDLEFHLIRLPDNSGIVKALNTGLQYLEGREDYKYIARLDCGDICHQERFFKQVTFLNKHLPIALLGTWCSFIESSGKKKYLYKTQTQHEAILREMYYKCSFIHPTVMFRKEVLQSIGEYPENFPHAEDYAFFWSILSVHKGAVLPENLVSIEISGQNISTTYFKVQLESRGKIISRFGKNTWLGFCGLFLLQLKKCVPVTFINRLKFYLYAFS